jgi:outer membrane protein
VRKLATKPGKFIAILVAAFVIAAAGAVATSATANAAPAASGIGYVDFRLLVAQHPDTPAAEKSIQDLIQQTEAEFKDKSANMNDQDKKNLYLQMKQQLDAKGSAIMGDIEAKVTAAIKEVADKKGLSVVVDKSVAIYGGEDLTAEVGKKLTGK